jgi:hypothetical protein
MQQCFGSGSTMQGNTIMTLDKIFEKKGTITPMLS